jgi:hypothetical protein
LRRSLIEGAWAPFIEWEDGRDWELNFPDGGRAGVYLEEGPETHLVHIDRPTSSLPLWAGLFIIMDETGSIAIGMEAGNFVTNESLIPQYESEFRNITVVASAEELRSYFWVERRLDD